MSRAARRSPICYITDITSTINVHSSVILYEISRHFSLAPYPHIELSQFADLSAYIIISLFNISVFSQPIDPPC